MFRRLAASILGLACILQAGAAAAQEYTFSAIRHPAVSSDARGTEVFGVNDTGLVVGHFHRDGVSHPFVYESGVFTDLALPFPGYWGGTARAINNGSQIVGAYFYDSTQMRAFVKRGGEFHELRLAGADSVIASGINNRGDILGTLVRPKRAREPFVLLGEKATFLKLPPGVKRSPSEGAFLIPDGISDRGHIVCTLARTVDGQARFTGYLYIDGKFTEIAFPNAKSTHPTGINAHGHVVGYFASGAPPRVRGFLYRNGSYVPVDYPDGRRTQLWGINSKGWIVGTFEDESARQRTGFVAVPR